MTKHIYCGAQNPQENIKINNIKAINYCNQKTDTHNLASYKNNIIIYI